MCSDLYYTEAHTFIAIVLIPDRSVGLALNDADCIILERRSILYNNA